MRLDVRLVLRSWQSGVLSGKRSRRSFFLLSIRLFFDTKSEREREREREEVGLGVVVVVRGG